MSTNTAADLLALSTTDVTQPIHKETLYTILQAPPFVYVPGTFNTRDLGLLPVPEGCPRIRPGFAYRTASLEGLKPEQGGAVLRDKLGIRRIFDLRSAQEHDKKPDPSVEGIEVLKLPSREIDATADLRDFVEGQGEKGYEKMYLEVLDLYQEGLKAVLAHVRDRPGEAFLFHCNGE